MTTENERGYANAHNDGHTNEKEEKEESKKQDCRIHHLFPTVLLAR